MTTKEEVHEALKDAAGADCEISLEAIRSLRKAYGGTQTATLNLNHCEEAHDLLMQTVRELKIDLVIISEPYRSLDTQLWETDKSRKAVIWSCGKYPFQDVAMTGEAGFVVLKLGGIHFYSCYGPSTLTFDEFADFLDRRSANAKQKSFVAIAGDFNAWAVDWAVADIYTASDHRAILWEVASGRRTRLVPKKRNAIGWKVSTFDSSTFLIAFDDCPIPGSNAKEKTDDIMRRVTDACDASMSRKRASNHHPPVYWWNNTIADLRKECNAARRSSQRGYNKPNCKEWETRYKKPRRKFTKAIKRSKKKTWNELPAEVEGDPWGRPYKTMMTRLKSQPMPSPTCPEVMEKIVTVLFPQQSLLQRGVEREEEELVPLITEAELLEACSRVGNTKAPGVDDVPNVALKSPIPAKPRLFLHA
ncbi:uncharacterized protein LOC107044425 [Diachasma alloeum]|uniref:uncharacterized protein LOC107044425 n=1 Tax=Diachasma alloeum TaxID=454923 RepID=UPI0007382859|nr:uncharacterized protein LOC107044425 [Diachasma alloeum]